MKFKFYALLTALLLLQVTAFANITVSIVSPYQNQLIDSTFTVQVTVGNTLNYSLPYIKVKVLDREVDLTWTGNNVLFTGQLNLKGLPPIDSLTLTVTAVGFNNDTVSASVQIIHKVTPYLYSLNDTHIALPNLRIMAKCTAYTGPCTIRVYRDSSMTVVAEATDSIDAVIDCQPTGPNGYLTIKATDTTGHITQATRNYIYETDQHFKGYYEFKSSLVNIVEVNFNKVLIKSGGYFLIGDMATDSITLITLPPSHPGGNVSVETINLTQNGAMATTQEEYYWTPDPDLPGDYYTIDGSYTVYKSQVFPGGHATNPYFGNVYFTPPHGNITYQSLLYEDLSDKKGIVIDSLKIINNTLSYLDVSEQQVVGGILGNKLYYYSKTTGENIGDYFLHNNYGFHATGKAVFYLKDSGNYSYNSFDGITARKIADINISDLNTFDIMAKNGFVVFNLNGVLYISGADANARQIPGTFEALDDSGGVVYKNGGYRYFTDVHGNVLLKTDRTYGAPYYFSGNWYIAYENVVYKVILPGILPTQLTTFTGQNKGTANQLNWQTAQEVNTAYFELQHATTTNRNFTLLTQVTAAGNSNITQSYAYAHTNPAEGTNYYRLKMVDKDGKFTYSRIVIIANGDNYFKVAVLPNPVRSNITLQLSSSTAQKVQVSIISLNGTALLTRQFDISAGITTKTIAAGSLAKGTYFIKVTGAGIAQANIKVIKE